MCTPGQEQTKQKQRGKGVVGWRVGHCKEVAVSEDSTASFTLRIIYIGLFLFVSNEELETII